MKIDHRILSSLEKVFPDETPACKNLKTISVLQGELLQFQWAICSCEGNRVESCIRVDSIFKDNISLYEVGCVPSMLPAYAESDNDFLRRSPGMYPDVLRPTGGTMSLVGGQWRSAWVEVAIPSNLCAGNYGIRLTLFSAQNPDEVWAEAEITVEVIGVTLPEQKLIYTNWFHCDCLALRYQVPVFSDEHWEIIRNYIKNAVRYGANMLLTPVFTPPLDTEVGGERPTVQLVGITWEEGKYHFDFVQLKRFMDLAWDCGIRYYEISHLFTQWGAQHAPKIVIKENGQEKKRFGWYTDARSQEYVSFINCFLLALKEHLKKEGRLDQCWFHISDEPSVAALESYRCARDSVRDILRDCRTMDALSDIAFYKEGLVPHPIPSTDHIDAFLEANIPHLWTYYCCGQTVDVSNRMMAMPSVRNRILGWQLYRYQIEGFLQWGYNFWFTFLSREFIDPYAVTDAGEMFPSGDAFIVYPGENGQPVSSIRQKVFYESLQDMRALQLLETQIGREATVAWLEQECGSPLTFRQYPREAEWILQTREKLNRKIAENIVLK
ncbi:MAG: DUF4091 domain-containing protein [Clostridiales bacterium]|nr:DUF4091 domain-containing protein [Clostridiales bacterium]